MEFITLRPVDLSDWGATLYYKFNIAPPL